MTITWTAPPASLVTSAPSIFGGGSPTVSSAAEGRRLEEAAAMRAAAASAERQVVCMDAGFIYRKAARRGRNRKDVSWDANRNEQIGRFTVCPKLF